MLFPKLLDNWGEVIQQESTNSFNQDHCPFPYTEIVICDSLPFKTELITTFSPYKLSN